MKDYGLLFRIKTLEKMIFRTFISNDNCEKIKKECIPTPTQMQILEYIIENEEQEIYQRDLEKILNLRRATVSEVLKTMEKNHLVERVIDTMDARSKKIILNADAKELFQSKQRQIQQIEKIMLEGIEPKELEIFSNILDKMKENIKKQSLLDNKKSKSCLKREEEK